MEFEYRYGFPIVHATDIPAALSALGLKALDRLTVR